MNLQDCLLLEIITYLDEDNLRNVVRNTNRRFKMLSIHCMRQRMSKNVKYSNDEDDSKDRATATSDQDHDQSAFDISRILSLKPLSHGYLDELQNKIMSPYRLTNENSSDDDDDSDSSSDTNNNNNNNWNEKTSNEHSKMSTKQRINKTIDISKCLYLRITNSNKLIWITKCDKHIVFMINVKHDSNQVKINSKTTKILIPTNGEILCCDEFIDDKSKQNYLFYTCTDAPNSIKWMSIMNNNDKNGELNLKNGKIKSFAVTKNKMFDNVNSNNNNNNNSSNNNNNSNNCCGYIVYDCNDSSQINVGKIVLNKEKIEIVDKVKLYKCSQDDEKIEQVYDIRFDISSDTNKKCYVFFKTSEFDDIQYGIINLDNNTGKKNYCMLHEFDATNMLGISNVNHFVMDEKKIYYWSKDKDKENGKLVARKLSYFGL